MKETIQTEFAPAAIGPYSQATRFGEFIFISGQIPMDPKDSSIAEGIEAQTRQVLENLKAIITAAGSSLDKVLKTTLFIKDMNQFNVINAIYGEYFPEKAPARACVEVARLPRDIQIEIDAIVGA